MTALSERSTVRRQHTHTQTEKEENAFNIDSEWS